MKRLLKLPVILGVGAAALALGGVAAATAGGPRPSIRPAQVSTDSPLSTDESQTGDVTAESTDATGSTDAASTDAPKTDSGAPAVESDVNDGEKDNVDDGAQHDAQDEAGDHHDESTASNAAPSSGSTTESSDDHGGDHKGD